MLPIRYSHYHLNVTDIDAHRKFWIDGLGGVPTKVGGVEAVRFTGVFVVLRQQPNTGGTKGTTVNHLGFQMQDLRRSIDAVKAAGFPMVTREEITSVAPEAIKDDVAYIPNQDAHVAMAMGPEGTKIELLDNKAFAALAGLHHVHFFTASQDETRDWYVKIFDATPGSRGNFKTAELPGVSLTMSGSAQPVVGTRGRVLDHIAFEVADLQAFCTKLEATGIRFDRPYVEEGELGVPAAFFTDPWGTSIELTEGLERTIDGLTN